METLFEILPLPIEIVRTIASYDRMLSVKRISLTDPRYDILKTIPKKEVTYYLAGVIRGWRVIFTNNCILSMVSGESPLPGSYYYHFFESPTLPLPDMYTYINNIDEDESKIFEWF